MQKLSQISAKIIADSISASGDRITTFELEYPRIIHAELMTHRVFSRNAMSSRAVPIKKMIAQVMNEPAMPVEFGKNKAGMQSDGDHDELICDYTAEEWWALAALSAARFASEFDASGYHKQVANRLLEPFQRMKTVLTSTEFDNFWWLRVDKDADPTLYALASVMKEAYDVSQPEFLKPGEWHTPYVGHTFSASSGLLYYVYDEDGKKQFLSKDEAVSISASCTAQVSYRVLNATKEKALSTYDKLVSGNKVHASPFEHQATPIAKRDLSGIKTEIGAVNFQAFPDSWEKGITHVDRNGHFWSGNLRGWVQNRQLVPGNVFNG